jgi:23S rRNA pseudouridine1911/1915/1917 synthase
MKHVIQADSTLIEAVALAFPDSAKRVLQNWIKWGRIFINDSPLTKANAPVLAGQTLCLQRKAPQQKALGIPILYQDRWMVVIDKPAGLLSVPAAKKEVNAFHLLKLGLKIPSLLPVHRLDQETSGVLLFVRSKFAEERFNSIFEQHDLEREYLAIVEGHLPSKRGSWEHYLKEREDYSVEVTTEEFGKRAVTHYEVVHRSKKFSFLRLKLETGRKHQIRVQAAHTGYPIVGDKRYGSLSNPYKRICLHAHLLSLIHPFTQKPMTFISKLNKTLAQDSNSFYFPPLS